MTFVELKMSENTILHYYFNNNKSIENWDFTVAKELCCAFIDMIKV